MATKIIVNGVLFDEERTTKNTVRFAEREAEGQPPAVGTIYVQKWALGNPTPKSVKVIIEAVE